MIRHVASSTFDRYILWARRSNIFGACPYQRSVFFLSKGMEYFFRDNLLLIGIIVVAIFGYLLLLIRKRKRQDYLHPDRKEGESTPEK